MITFHSTLPKTDELLSTSGENVATTYNVSRLEQDTFAASSYQKAVAAQKAGRFVDEIVPVLAKRTDPKTGEETMVLVTEDDGIRDGVTVESLSKLKPVFSKTGSTHAGNASQVSFLFLFLFSFELMVTDVLLHLIRFLTERQQYF